MINELTENLLRSFVVLDKNVNNHPMWNYWKYDPESATDMTICLKVGKIISPDSKWSFRQPWIIDIESIVKDLNYV